MDRHTADVVKIAFEEKTGIEISILALKAMSKLISEDDTENYALKTARNFFIISVIRARNGEIEKVLVGEFSKDMFR